MIYVGLLIDRYLSIIMIYDDNILELKSEVDHFAAPCRLCELRQPCLVPGGHPVDERLPDWNEAAEGAAQTLQERQQALLRAPGLRRRQRQPEPRCRNGGVTVSGWSATERLVHRELVVGDCRPPSAAAPPPAL